MAGGSSVRGRGRPTTVAWAVALVVVVAAADGCAGFLTGLNTWSTTEPTVLMPPGRAGHASTAITLQGRSPSGANNRTSSAMLMFGGIIPRDVDIDTPVLSFTDLFILGHDTWILVPVAPSKDSLDRQYLWQIITNSSSTQPPQRFFHTLSTVFPAQPGEIALLFGGQTNENGVTVALDDLWVFNSSSLLWSEIPHDPAAPWPKARRGHCTAIRGSTLVLFGGVTYDGGQATHLDDTWVFELNTGKWTELAGLTVKPTARAHASCSYSADMFYVHGGTGFVDGIVERFQVLEFQTSNSLPNLPALSDLWVFDLDRRLWRLLSDGTENPVALGSMAMLGGRLVAWGGFEHPISPFSNPYQSIRTFDLAGGTAWQKAQPVVGDAPLGTAAASLSLLQAGGAQILVSFGGFTSYYLTQFEGTTATLTAATAGFVWSQSLLPDRPPPMSAQSSVNLISSLGTNFLVVFGGWSADLGKFGCTFNGQTWGYDYDYSIWIQFARSEAPINRGGHTAVAIDKHCMWVFGGTSIECNGDNTFYNDLHQFCLTNSEWTALPNSNPPAPRYGHNAQLHDGQMYIFGGAIFNRVRSFTLFNDVWVYRLGTGWRELTTTNPPTPRYGSSSALYGARLFIFAGTTSGSFVSGNQVTINDMHTLDLATGAWTRVVPNGASPGARTHAASVQLDTVWTVIGGGDYFEPITSNTWVYSFLSNSWFEAKTESPPGAVGSSRFYSSAVAKPASRNRVVVFAGVSGKQLGLNSVAEITPGCNAGSASRNIALEPCTVCPLGTFAKLGDTACQACPPGTTTATQSATEVDACNVCAEGHCGHGTCLVRSDGGVPFPVCGCDFGFSVVSNCKTNLFAIWFSVSIVAVVAALAVAAYLQFRKRRRYRLRTSLRERLLDDNEYVLEDLQSAWRIPAEAISLETHLASGSFAEVWLGSYLGKEVIVKQLRVGLARDEAELEALAHRLTRLSDKHILQFYGVGNFGAIPFVVSENVFRGNLRELLDDHSKLVTWPLVLSIGLGVANGMAYLHAQEPACIHGNLSSRRVFLNRQFAVKIGGISETHLLDQVPEQAQMLAWKAPETLQGAPASEASDVYGFAIIAWELATRHIPFADCRGVPTPKFVDILLSGTRPTPAITTDFPFAYAHFIDLCWATDPATRHSFARVVSTLDTLLHGEH